MSLTELGERTIVCRCLGTPVMSQVLTPVTFVLKGGGWAKDGYSKR